MQERAVTIAGTRHALEDPFFVLATENPFEMEGTYPLPEAQLDRFLLKVLVLPPSEDEMVSVLASTTGRAAEAPRGVLGRDEVLRLAALCRDVAVAEPVMRYAARLVRATDPTADGASPLARKALRYGAGVRGAQALVLAAKARALLSGRPQASFADVGAVAKPALRHRLIRSFEGEAEGIATDQVIDALVADVPSRPDRVEAALASSASSPAKA
jgi:MoxR-like ATPase